MKRKLQIYILAVGFFIAMPAMAQMNNAATTVAASQLKMLLQLKRFWQTKFAVMQTGSKECKFPYYDDFKVVSDKNGIAMHEWANMPGLGKLDGSNLAGVNTLEGKIHWYSLDNMGATHENVGEFSDDKHFTVMHISMKEGKEFTETLVIELPVADMLILKQVSKLDGEGTAVITGALHRKKIK